MRSKPRNPWWLVLGISGISLLAWFVNTYPPDSLVRMAVFFILFFLTSFSIAHFILNNVRRSVLLSFGLIVYLLLRLLNLREPLYPLLLFITLISLEVFFRTK
ncbi:hypothetical protein HY086_05920 [Candidatus Gottesmanbacteria bacterium]|nr:hypothetical protein [Candidatus Gottesmanbacteria bacterium]